MNSDQRRHEMNFTFTRKTLLGAGIVAGTILTTAAPALSAGNLVVDGGFESPGVTQDASAVANGYITIPPGTVGAWAATGEVDTVTGSPDVPIAHAYWWQAAEGNQSLDLNGLAPGTISQSIPTTIGASYTLSFMMAGNPYGGSGPAVKQVRVAAGTTTVDLSFDVTGKTPADMGWRAESLTFTASSASTVISFTSLSGGSGGVALDKIVVESNAPEPVIPEVPFALLLPLAGAAVLGGVIVRRRGAAVPS